MDVNEATREQLIQTIQVTAQALRNVVTHAIFDGQGTLEQIDMEMRLQLEAAAREIIVS